MNTVKISVNVDKDTKKNVDSILEEMGLNFTTAINIYLKKIEQEKAIPFELSLKKSSLSKSIEELNDIIKNPNKYKGFDSVEEFFKELDI